METLTEADEAAVSVSGETEWHHYHSLAQSTGCMERATVYLLEVLMNNALLVM